MTTQHAVGSVSAKPDTFPLLGYVSRSVGTRSLSNPVERLGYWSGELRGASGLSRKHPCPDRSHVRLVIRARPTGTPTAPAPRTRPGHLSAPDLNPYLNPYGSCVLCLMCLLDVLVERG